MENNHNHTEHIAVLLAAYNGETYIEEQLDSILAQTVPGIQIIISDDGSADGTREILERYQKQYPGQVVPKHRPQVEKKKQGSGVPAPAGNFFWLLSQTDADHILFSDQDDVWHPKKVERMLERMYALEGQDLEQRGSEQPVLVFSDMEVVDENLRLISRSFFEYSRCNPDRLALPQLLTENPVTGGAMMINRRLAQMVETNPAVCFMHDWWIALCACCFGTIECIKEPLYSYRQHSSNTLGAKKTGSFEDMKARLTRQEQVDENYRRMFAQAAAFMGTYREWLTDTQRSTLQAYLALPLQSPIGRLRNIVRNHFCKSMALQTLAQCFTIPHPEKEVRG